MVIITYSFISVLCIKKMKTAGTNKSERFLSKSLTGIIFLDDALKTKKNAELNTATSELSQTIADPVHPNFGTIIKFNTNPQIEPITEFINTALSFPIGVNS